MKPKLIVIWLLFIELCALAQNSPYRLYNTHNGLPQIQVTAIFQDVHGYVWIGTKAGLAQFNGEHFHQFLPNEHIHSIANNKNGDLFVKATKGLYRYDGHDFDLIYQSDKRFKTLISHKHYFLYCKDWIEQYNNDSLINTYTVGVNFPVGGIQSLAFDGQSGSVYCTGFVTDDVFKLDGNNFTRVYMAPDGWKVNVGHLTQDHPVILIHKAGEIRFLSLPSGQHLFTCWVGENRIKKMEVHQLPLKQYLHSYMYDYYMLDSATNTAQKIDLDYVKGPFPVLNDRDDNLWVGSDNGLYQVWERPFKTFPRSFMNDFWTLIEGDDQQLYGAAYKQGLFLLDLKRQKKYERLARGPFEDSERDYYYGASKDKNGRLYFPSHYGLVKYHNSKATKLTKDVCLISKYDSLSGQIVFGKQYGLSFLQANGKIKSVIDKSNAIVQSHPSSLAFTDSAIWVGTGRSLGYYHRTEKEFRPLHKGGEDGPKVGIISMAKDDLGNIWMGGREGLFVFRAEKQKFEKLAVNYSGFITAIMVPNEELLLIGTTREVLVLRFNDYLAKGKLTVKTYNFRNGLIAQEIAQNGFIRWHDKILFPSTTNTTMLDLNQVNYKTEFFNVAITHLNDQPIAYKNRSDSIELKLEYGHNDLEFNFETIGFGLPTKPVYKYRLIGKKDEWSNWSEHDYANYNNLASGEYTFEVAVKPALISEAEMEKTARLKLLIQMPFYKEPHFYKIAFFILLLLSLITAYVARSRYQFKTKAIAHERKKRYLEVASLQANLNPHFIFNLLASVQNLITQHQPEKANQYLIKFSRLIRAYMEATIKSSKVVDGSDSDNEISLKEEIDLLKMYIEFEQVKYRGKAFDYNIIVEDDNLINRLIPPMIIQPFVENAIKHGLYPCDCKGQLNIYFSGSADKLICKIVDNGIGRKESMRLKENSIKAYESRGVELINKRVAILNELGYRIEIDFEDPAEGGTIVNIVFN